MKIVLFMCVYGILPHVLVPATLAATILHTAQYDIVQLASGYEAVSVFILEPGVVIFIARQSMTIWVHFDVLMHVPPCYSYLFSTSNFRHVFYLDLHVCPYFRLSLWAPLHVCVGSSHHQALF